jgi:hypothetical protein
MLSDGIADRENLSAMSITGGFLRREVAASRAFMEGRRLVEVRAERLERAVFKAINEEVESGGGGRFAGGEASHKSQSRLALEVSSEFRDGLIAKDSHQQEGAKQGEGINWRAATGRVAVEGIQERGKRVKV